MTEHVNPNGLRTSGIWGSSTPSDFKTYVIFCVGNDPYREAAFRAWALENGIGFKSLKGCYKGQQENSFIINEENLGRCYRWFSREESILFIGPMYRNGRLYGNREAHLYYLKTGEREDLGLFQWVPRSEALKEDAWTYDPTQDLYFICRKA